MSNETNDVPAPVRRLVGPLRIVFKDPRNGDYYCDGMLSWEDICEALEPAVNAGLITINHKGDLI
jgi:hypothetical protein